MKESMVIYESAYKAINYLPDEKLQLQAYRGLMEYGFYGVIPESENPYVNMVYVQAIPSMRSAAERYEKSVEDGRKGGRPTKVPTTEIIKMKESGMTNKQIAEKLGVSEKTIENRVTIYNKSNPYNPHIHPITSGFGGMKNDEEHPHNPHNLSISYTDTVSETISYTDTETETVIDSPQTKTDNIYPEEKEVNDTKPVTPPEKKLFISGDGLPGRRIRDLSNDEAMEIKKKLKQNIPYLDIEREYEMRRGTITAKFNENWRLFICAKVNGRV